MKRKARSLPSRKITILPEFDGKAEKFRSGCTPLDCILGGGWAVGRTINIIGDKSTGKTLLATEACANFLSKHQQSSCYYYETEGAFDIGYARSLGIPVDRITLVESVETIEEFQLAVLHHIAEADPAKPTLVVLDSLDACSDTDEQASDGTKGTYGLGKQKALSKLFRKTIRGMQKKNITLIVISQIRENIGVTFGPRFRRAGGKALDFYCSQVVWLTHLGKEVRTIKGVKRVVGVKTRAECQKNKVGIPHRSAEFPIIFMYGVDDLQACYLYLTSVKRDRDLEEQTVAVAKRTNALQRNPDQYMTAVRDARRVTRKAYREVETQFLPVLRKYASK